MDAVTVEMIKAGFGALFGAMGAYIAIRADLSDLKARMKIAEEANSKAHEHIDKILGS